MNILRRKSIYQFLLVLLLTIGTLFGVSTKYVSANESILIGMEDEFEPPSIWAYTSHNNFVNFVDLEFWPQFTDVTFSILDQNNIVIFEDTIPTDESGWAGFSEEELGTVILSKGQTLIADDGTTRKQYIIPELTVDIVDIDNAIVEGKTDDNHFVMLQVYDYLITKEWISFEMEALDEGNWSFDITEKLDYLTISNTIEINFPDDDGDRIWLWSVQLNPHILVSANDNDEYIVLQDWEIGKDVTVFVDNNSDLDDGYIWIGEFQMAESHEYAGVGELWITESIPDIEPTNYVTATDGIVTIVDGDVTISDGARTKVLMVEELYFDWVDLEVNRAEGRGPDNAELRGWIETDTGWYPLNGVIGPDGFWDITFDESGIPSSEVYLAYVQVSEPDIDTTNAPYTKTPPTANAGGPYYANEGDIVTLDASGSTDPENNISSYGWDLDNDGNYDDAEGVTASLSVPQDGEFPISVLVVDSFGAEDTANAVVSVANVKPGLGEITAPVAPVELGTEISVNSAFTDPGDDTWTVTWDWGDGTSSDGSVAEFVASGTHVYQEAGVYTLQLTVSDGIASDSATFEYVVVYDPDGGFVTGGGWIQPPVGAYTLDPSLSGKATFGFVSKYKKGADVPTGNTEFHFKVADFHFKSTAYQWLVIAGNKAKFKGEGEINGQSGYGFMISALDGDPDKFRIKIWEMGTETVVYDNQPEAEEDADPVTALEGGSIVVHKK